MSIGLGRRLALEAAVRLGADGLQRGRAAAARAAGRCAAPAPLEPDGRRRARRPGTGRRAGAASGRARGSTIQRGPGVRLPRRGSRAQWKGGARDGRLAGHRARHRAASSPRRARASRSARARRSASRRRPREIGARPYVHDMLDLDCRPRARAQHRGRTSGPIDILVTNTGGPPGRRPARLHARAVGAGAPRARAGANRADRAGRARHARARLRAGAERRLLDRARAEPGADALELPPARDRRGVQDARARLRRRRDHLQLAAARPDRDQRLAHIYGSLEAAHEAAPRRDPRRAARHARGHGSGRRLPVLGARRATSRAWPCWSTAG